MNNGKGSINNKENQKINMEALLYNIISSLDHMSQVKLSEAQPGLAIYKYEDTLLNTTTTIWALIFITNIKHYSHKNSIPFCYNMNGKLLKLSDFGCFDNADKIRVTPISIETLISAFYKEKINYNNPTTEEEVIFRLNNMLSNIQDEEIKNLKAMNIEKDYADFLFDTGIAVPLPNTSRRQSCTSIDVQLTLEVLKVALRNKYILKLITNTPLRNWTVVIGLNGFVYISIEGILYSLSNRTNIVNNIAGKFYTLQAKSGSNHLFSIFDLLRLQ